MKGEIARSAASGAEGTPYPARALVGSIQKFSVEDGPGIRTSVFFKGCPLRCRWCHNPELMEREQQLIQTPNNCIGCGHCLQICPQQAITMDPEEGIRIARDRCDVCLLCAEECFAKALRPVAREMSIQEITAEAALDKAFYDSTGGGVTLSGGEILMQGGFVPALIEALEEEGIGVCLDTCGFADPALLLDVARMPAVTDILYDIKAIDDAVHRTYTGVSNRRILSNLQRLAMDPVTAAKLTIRMPLIRGVNDTPDMIRRTGKLLVQLDLRRVTLLPYHDLGISKARHIGSSQEAMQPPSQERMEEIRRDLQQMLGEEPEILGLV